MPSFARRSGGERSNASTTTRSSSRDPGRERRAWWAWARRGYPNRARRGERRCGSDVLRPAAVRWGRFPRPTARGSVKLRGDAQAARAPRPSRRERRRADARHPRRRGRGCAAHPRGAGSPSACRPGGRSRNGRPRVRPLRPGVEADAARGREDLLRFVSDPRVASAPQGGRGRRRACAPRRAPSRSPRVAVGVNAGRGGVNLGPGGGARSPRRGAQLRHPQRGDCGRRRDEGRASDG